MGQITESARAVFGVRRPVPSASGARTGEGRCPYGDRLMGSGRQLPADERATRQQRVIRPPGTLSSDQIQLHPLNPVWDQQLSDTLEQGRLRTSMQVNDALSALAGKSTHEGENLGCCIRRYFCLWPLRKPNAVITARFPNGSLDSAP